MDLSVAFGKKVYFVQSGRMENAGIIIISWMGVRNAVHGKRGPLIDIV